MHDGRLFGTASQGANTELRIEQHARRRVEHGLRFLGLRAVGTEVFAIGVFIGRHVAPEQWQALGANGVIGRGRALLREPGQIVAAREGKAARIGVRGKYQREAGDS